MVFTLIKLDRFSQYVRPSRMARIFHKKIGYIKLLFSLRKYPTASDIIATFLKEPPARLKPLEGTSGLESMLTRKVYETQAKPTNCLASGSPNFQKFSNRQGYAV